MNESSIYANLSGYSYLFKNGKRALRCLNGACEELAVYDIYQFDDYSKYSIFNTESKKSRNDIEFSKYCKKTFDMGKHLVS